MQVFNISNNPQTYSVAHTMQASAGSTSCSTSTSCFNAGFSIGIGLGMGAVIGTGIWAYFYFTKPVQIK